MEYNNQDPSAPPPPIAQVVPEAAPEAVPEVAPQVPTNGEVPPPLEQTSNTIPIPDGTMFQNPVAAFPTIVPIESNGVAGDATAAANGTAISADEIALYDRQIRLWGMQAQEKIRSANILLITMKALGNEIAKNLVLAGIGSLTIVDHELATEADLGAQFFLSEEHLGINRAEAASAQIQKLNPRVKVHVDTSGVMTKGASYFSMFDIIIATDLDPTFMTFINTATRLHQRPFYSAGTHGLYGFIFSDLIEHDYVLQRDKPNVPTVLQAESRTRSIIDTKTKKEDGKVIELVTKRELYSTWDLASDASYLPQDYLKSKRRLRTVTPALSCLKALWKFQSDAGRLPGHNRQDLELFTKTATFTHGQLSLPSETLKSEFLRSFLQNIGSEIAPVAAILGGQLAQDVINVLGQSQQPIQNMVIFDGNTMEANVYPLHPDVPLGKAQLQTSTDPMAGAIIPDPALMGAVDGTGAGMIPGNIIV